MQMISTYQESRELDVSRSIKRCILLNAHWFFIDRHMRVDIWM